MSASLHVPSNSAVNTSSKKQSTISNNKPNCGGTTKEEKKDDAQPPNPDSKENTYTNEQNDIENEVKMPKREITPDIISGSILQKQPEEHEMKPQVMEAVKPITEEFETKDTEAGIIDDTAVNDTFKEETHGETIEGHNNEDLKEGDHSLHAHTPAKKIITSEEEAKARFAEKRREMKEKMEREAELERQRQVIKVGFLTLLHTGGYILPVAVVYFRYITIQHFVFQAEIERLEEERRLKEEEEERKAMEEAEKLAAVARKAEEERLQKAIEEAQKREAEERAKRDDEERIKKEAEQKAAVEAERKQAELEEKLKKEEEERLARKKRIEEIMARTRGGSKASTASPAGTPKKVA